MKSPIKSLFLCLAFIAVSSSSILGQIINNETKIHVAKNGVKTIERTILLQINNKESNGLSEISIHHDPRDEFIFGYAQIIDSKGKIVRKLKKKELITSNAFSNQAFFQDDLLTIFELYWSQYPYRIEYSYTIKQGEYLSLANWTPLISKSIPTLSSSLEIVVPKDFPLKIDQRGEIDYQKSQTEEGEILKWEFEMVALPVKESFSPSFEELIPWVRVYPIEFKYGVYGSFDSWASFGQWQEKLNEGAYLLPEEEKAIVEKLVAGIEDKREIVKTLYYYLQDHTKYVNVSIDIGGLKSYPASYVCQNKYGDCKALTTYMKALLNSVGIPSFYSIIQAGKNPMPINKDFPSNQFNHVILAVPMENDTVWLENTSNTIPFNYLGSFTQNRYSLSINGKNTLLLKTPKLEAEHVLVERTFAYKANENGQWNTMIDLQLRGEEMEGMRYYSIQSGKKEQKEYLLDLIDIDKFELELWEKVDYHKDDHHIKIGITGNCPEPIRKLANLEVINPLKISIPTFEKPKLRKLDVRINYPINRLDKSIYTIEGLKSKTVELPENLSIETVYGTYSTKYTREGDLITITEHFTLFDNQIEIIDYHSFYSFILEIEKHQKKSAIILK